MESRAAGATYDAYQLPALRDPCHSPLSAAAAFARERVVAVPQSTVVQLTTIIITELLPFYITELTRSAILNVQIFKALYVSKGLLFFEIQSHQTKSGKYLDIFRYFYNFVLTKWQRIKELEYIYN